MALQRSSPIFGNIPLVRGMTWVVVHILVILTMRILRIVVLCEIKEALRTTHRPSLWDDTLPACCMMMSILTVIRSTSQKLCSS